MLTLNTWITNIIAIFIIVLFIIIERKLRIGDEARSLESSKTDNNSTNFIAIALMTSLLSIFVSIFLNMFGIGLIMHESIAYTGIIFMILGLSIRILAARTLGRFYTRTLKTVNEQEIINKGIYKYIRHPGYLGDIILFIAGGLASRNYISLCVSIVLIIPAYLYRIQTEEKMLSAQFGAKYDGYKKKTSRLLPGIF